MKIAKCTRCGSEDVSKDADAAWDRDEGRWVINTTYDNGECHACGNSGNMAVDIFDEEPEVTAEADEPVSTMAPTPAAEALPPLPSGGIKSSVAAVTERLAHMNTSKERLLSTFSEPEPEQIVEWWDEFVGEARKATGTKAPADRPIIADDDPVF